MLYVGVLLFVALPVFGRKACESPSLHGVPSSCTRNDEIVFKNSDRGLPWPIPSTTSLDSVSEHGLHCLRVVQDAKSGQSSQTENMHVDHCKSFLRNIRTFLNTTQGFSVHPIICSSMKAILQVGVSVSPMIPNRQNFVSASNQPVSPQFVSPEILTPRFNPSPLVSPQFVAPEILTPRFNPSPLVSPIFDPSPRIVPVPRGAPQVNQSANQPLPKGGNASFFAQQSTGTVKVDPSPRIPPAPRVVQNTSVPVQVKNCMDLPIAASQNNELTYMESLNLGQLLMKEMQGKLSMAEYDYLSFYQGNAAIQFTTILMVCVHGSVTDTIQAITAAIGA